jgi:hypothetical protein
LFFICIRERRERGKNSTFLQMISYFSTELHETEICPDRTLVPSHTIMIILSTPTSLPPAFQPLVADDVRQSFPWDAFTTIRRDVTPPLAGPSTPRRQHGRPSRRARAPRSYTDEHDDKLPPESTDDENNSDDPDYLPTVDEPTTLAVSSPNGKPRSQSKPRSRSQSRARELSTPATGEKRYICEEEGCGKSFAKPAKLKEHALSHTGEVSLRMCHLRKISYHTDHIYISFNP